MDSNSNPIIFPLQSGKEPWFRHTICLHPFLLPGLHLVSLCVLCLFSLPSICMSTLMNSILSILPLPVHSTYECVCQVWECHFLTSILAPTVTSWSLGLGAVFYSWTLPAKVTSYIFTSVLWIGRTITSILVYKWHWAAIKS